MKNYTGSPLPFQGQKRGFLKAFKTALKEFPSNAVYVDMFGGSGLLSHTVKTYYPNAKVIYNDYDSFSSRLKAINQTNELLNELRNILQHLEPKQRLHLFDKDKVCEAILKHEKKYNFVDCVTLSASLLFSGQYCTKADEFRFHMMYNRVRKSEIPLADDYLQEVEVVCKDYKLLFEEYKNNTNVVFLLDPPYLSTDTKSYNSDGYWKLKDYLDVLNLLDVGSYFYFTSDKSHLVELCEWFGTRSINANPFRGSTKQTVTNSVNYSSKYQDIMMYKYTE